MKHLALLCLLLPLPLLAAQTGYRVVQPDGTVEFTDQPTREGAEPIRLEEVPTYPAPRQSPARSTGLGVPPPGDEVTPDYEVEVTRPVPDEQIWAGSGWQVPVTVGVTPPVASDHAVVILLDGEEVAYGAGTHTLQPVYLGTHRLSARVVGTEGDTLAESGIRTFHVRRHSILTPP